MPLFVIGLLKKGFKCYHLESRQFYTSKDGIFDELKFCYSHAILKPTSFEDIR